MSDVVIAAAVGGAFALAGNVVALIVTHAKTVAAIKAESDMSDAKLSAELEKHQAVTDTKIDELTRKVERHNSIIERTYRLEGAVTELQHEVRDLKGA